VITANGKSAPARLIFDSIDGTISGWNPDVDPTHAIVMVDNFAAGHPAVYTGLDMAQNSQGQNVLYATDIINNRVEMLVGSFNATPSYFTDPTATKVDAGFGAWSVQAVNSELYVTFGNPFSPVSGRHGGVVDVFDTDGHLLTPNHFAANAPGAGPLENPWGITQVPVNFGAYSNDLLIGNVAGAGNINVYNPDTGAYLGKLDQPDGSPVAIKGLWDLEFGDGTPNGAKTNQLFFDAGPNAPGVSGYGLFGVIHAAGDQSGNSIGDPVGEAAAPAVEVLTVNESTFVPVSNNLVGMSTSQPNLSSQQNQAIKAPSLMSGAIVTADSFAQPMTTRDGSTAGTTGGTPSDGGSTDDSNWAFDITITLTSGELDLIKNLQSGDWWVSLSGGATSPSTKLWATWNPNVTWVDVQVGDFTGDGKDDITGRVLQSGDWWTGVSTGSSFTIGKWASWSAAVTWVDVQS
jgi:uncharacterized protein (TIGR03118 family)